MGDGSLQAIRIDDEYTAVVLKFAPESLVRTLALHPSGELMITGTDDAWATVWSMSRSRAAAEFAKATEFAIGPVNGRVGLLGDGLRIVDQDLKIVDKRELGPEEVSVMCFSPTGRFVALGREDGNIAVVDLAARNAVTWHGPAMGSKSQSTRRKKDEEQESSDAVVSLRFRNDERLIVVMRSGIAELDVSNLKEIPRLDAAIPSNVALAADGSYLVTKNEALKVYDLRTFDDPWVIPTAAFDPAVAVSPSGEFVAGRASGSTKHQSAGPTEETMTVWNVATRKAVVAVPVSSTTSAMAFDATPQLFAYSDGKNVHVWNLNSKERTDLVQRKSEVGALQFHPKEPLLAVGYGDRMIRLWTVSPEPRIVTEIPQDEALEFGSKPFRFTADGRYLVRAQDATFWRKIIGFFAWIPEDLVAQACSRAIRKKLEPAVWNEHLRGQSYRETCSPLAGTSAAPRPSEPGVWELIADGLAAAR